MCRFNLSIDPACVNSEIVGAGQVMRDVLSKNDLGVFQ